jgi:hypothetical protein
MLCSSSLYKILSLHHCQPALLHTHGRHIMPVMVQVERALPGMRES